MPEEIVAIYLDDVIIPLKKLDIHRDSRIKILAEKVETGDQSRS